MHKDLFQAPPVRRVNRRDLLALAIAPLTTVDSDAGPLRITDSRLPQSAPRHWRVHHPSAGHKIRCPRLRQLYTRMRPVTCQEGAIDRLRFRIYSASPEHDSLAARCGQALAIGFWLTHDYLDRAHGGVCDLWLRAGGPAGGEEYQGSLYLHAVDEDRSPLEWLRELLHEYSHRTLPPFGPFEAPERHASGYLGEKLLLRWLQRSDLLKRAWPGLDTGAAGRSTTGKIELQETAGSAAPGANGAMERFIGDMLAVETVYGPQVLAALMRVYRDVRPQRLPLFLGEVLGAGPARREVRPLNESGLQFRLLTPPGRWSVQTPEVAGGETSAIDNQDGAPLPRERRDGMLRFALVAAPGAWMDISFSRPVALAYQVRE